jgi:hypothetical protein
MDFKNTKNRKIHCIIRSIADPYLVRSSPAWSDPDIGVLIRIQMPCHVNFVAGGNSLLVTWQRR